MLTEAQPRNSLLRTMGTLTEMIGYPVSGLMVGSVIARARDSFAAAYPGNDLMSNVVGTSYSPTICPHVSKKVRCRWRPWPVEKSSMKLECQFAVDGILGSERLRSLSMR